LKPNNRKINEVMMALKLPYMGLSGANPAKSGLTYLLESDI